MANYMKYGIGSFKNIAALSIESTSVNYDRKLEIKKVSERFLQSAMLLPENEILGCQISLSENDLIAGYTFSSSGITVTSEDYCWIFKSYGKAKKTDSSKIRNLYEEGRKVYVLSSVPEGSENAPLGRNNAGYLSSDDNYDNMTPDNDFSEMFDMLMKNDAVIHLVAGPSKKKDFGHGMFLISLPGEITLRMRAVISLAFPHAEVVEFNTFDIKKNERLISDKVYLNGMTKFLITLLQRTSNKESVKQQNSDEDTIAGGSGKSDTSRFTSIEDLELSVRSYNCLRRAGITNVEKLRTMSDEELIQVRNLGRKCIAEIRQKLSDINVTTTPGVPKTVNYMNMLNELIGLEEVKEQIKRITSFAKMKKDMALKGNDGLSVSLNMEFVGNPGTAKTTVARIIANIFYEIGLLPSNELVEVGRADLVAEYEGQTTSKVKRIFRRANGKVLFIDEAYSLVEQWEGMFGDEAISTIVQEMENHREDTIVIFAGYPKNMEAFFARNPGLRSRVPFRIIFKDYSAEALLQIVKYEAKKRGFSIQDEAESKLKSICQTAVGNERAGNGRFCRNIVENAIIGYASRVYGSENVNVENDFRLIAADFTTTGMIEEKKYPLGFSVL